MNKHRSTLLALCGIAVWGALMAMTVRRTAPRRDPTFVVSRDELDLNREDSSHLTLLALDGFDRERVVVERDGAAIPHSWDGDRLVANLEGSTPGTHVVTAGIRHQGGVTRMASVPVAVGAPAPFARRYERAIRLQLPTALFDDGVARTHADLADTIASSMRAKLEGSDAARTLGLPVRVRLGIALGARDDLLSAAGSACFQHGCVRFEVVLQLVRQGDRVLRLEPRDVEGLPDDALRSWARSQGAFLGGGAALLLSAHPFAFLLGIVIGSRMGEQQAQEEAQRRLDDVVSNALSQINRGLVLPEEFQVPGLPTDTSVHLAYSGTPVVSDEEGLRIDLDVFVEDARGLTTLSLSDPATIDSATVLPTGDRARVQFSRSLLGAALIAVGNRENINAGIEAAASSDAARSLPISIASVRVVHDAMPWGGRRTGLTWSVPDVGFNLASELEAHAFLAGRIDLQAGPGGSSIRAIAIPEFVSVGCRRASSNGIEYLPCLDIIGVAAPDLPHRLEQHIAPVDLFGDALRSVRRLPIDADGDAFIEATLVEATSSTGNDEFAAALEFDVQTVRRVPRRATRLHRGRP